MSLTDNAEMREFFKRPEVKGHTARFDGTVPKVDSCYKLDRCKNPDACSGCNVYITMNNVRKYNDHFQGDDAVYSRK
jgi:hypothetical protein